MLYDFRATHVKVQGHANKGVADKNHQRLWCILRRSQNPASSNVFPVQTASWCVLVIEVVNHHLFQPPKQVGRIQRRIPPTRFGARARPVLGCTIRTPGTNRKTNTHGVGEQRARYIHHSINRETFVSYTLAAGSTRQ